MGKTQKLSKAGGNASDPTRMVELMQRLEATASYRVLEQRMVFDGAAVDTAATAADAHAEGPPAPADGAEADAADPRTDTGDLLAALAAAPVEPQPAASVVVFIDSQVKDADVIAAALPEGALVVYLDADRDGVEQIAAALEGLSDVDAIHIVSHGSQGALFLGSATLDLESISGVHAGDLAAIGSALSDNADILVYGCDAAAGDEGAAFAAALAQATGADVAASTDDTGSAELGGDWSLEHSVGSIEVHSIVAVDWQHLLAPITITNLDGTTTTAGTLADNIAGAGVTVVSAAFSGDNSQGGTFTGGTGYPAEWLAFDSGVIFSSGSTGTVTGPNTADNTSVNAPGTGTDADFTAIGGGITSFDAASLTISFIPTSNRVTLQFVMGSEEYNEYVYANFNDAIGVWVNGAHVSLTPSGSAISIDSINQAGTFNPVNGNQIRDPFPANGVFDSASPSLFVNNTPGTGAYDTAMDGFTVTLSLVANVNVGVVNTIKLGVSDIGDANYDTWLFVKENSLQAETIANTDFASTTTNTAVVIDALANDWDSNNDPLAITHVADQPITAGGAPVSLASGATVQLTLAGTLLYTPPAGYNGYEDFTYAISDGAGTSAVGFVHVSIGPNTPPIIDLNDNGTSAGRDSSVTYTEGAAAVAIAATNATVIDPNDISYTQLDITLGGFQAAGSEVLSIGGTAFTYGAAQTSTVVIGATAFSISYDGVNGVSVQNAAPLSEIPDATMEGLIRSITYRHDGDDPTAGARTLSFVLSDGQATSNTAVATINVAAVNDAPVNTLPAAFNAGTSAPIPLVGLSVADADAGSGTLTTTLTVSSGTLSAMAVAGVAVSGSGTSSLTLTGTVSALNAFLAASPPTFSSDGTGTVVLTMLTSDGGNTGSGGVLTDSDVATINVAHGPVVDLNSTYTVSTSTTTAASNLVTNGTFSDNSATPSGWTESGTIGTGASGRYIWTSATDSLSQALTVPADTSTVATSVSGGQLITTQTVTTNAITSISFGMAWQNADTSGANDNRLTISYGGVTYATFTTGGGGGATGTWSYSNGASGPATTAAVGNEATGALTAITIALPSGITSSGNLVFTYGAGPSGNGSDDLAIDNIVVTNTASTTTTTYAADLADNDWAATYTENGPPVAIADLDVSVFDFDSADMASATITLTNPQTGDRLLVDGSSSASGTLASGVQWTRTDTAVSFTNIDSRADYAAALALVQFENTTDAPSSGVVRDITVTVSDGTHLSNTAHAFITVTPVNDAPIAVDDSFTVAEDGSVSVPVLGNDSDVDGDTLTVTHVDGIAITDGGPSVTVANGTVALVGGQLVFTPDADYHGPASFSYTITDGTVSATADVAGTVTPGNDAPIAVDDTSRTREGAAVDIDVLKNDSDPDGDPLRVIAATSSHGTVLVRPNGSIRFTPAAGFSGNAQITYVVSDGRGGTSTARVSVEVGAEPPVETGLPFVPSGREEDSEPPSSPAPREPMDVDGIVLDTVGGLGSLGGISAQLGERGIVLAAVNGVEPLKGLAGADIVDPRAEAVPIAPHRLWEIERLLGCQLTGSDTQTWDVRGLTGFSLRMGLLGDSDEAITGSKITIESLVRERILIVHVASDVTDASRGVAEYRMMQANGEPLPGWLERIGAGVLMGERPADLETLELKLTVIYSDGSYETKGVAIETISGEIKPLLVKEAAMPLPFQAQFAVSAPLTEDAGRELARLLYP